MIVLKLLSGGVIADDTVPYAWWATGLAVLGVILYFLALMSSHLAAFRVESNIRKDMMRKVVEMPLGFFDVNTSGKIRKIIDDNASVTHSFIAHQLPDLAGAVLVPLIGIVMIIAVDWRMGLVCLVPVAGALMLMGFSMGEKGRHFMASYMDSLEEMNSEAVEYVRGIPVVKVFQQTIYSFKNFHRSIMDYSRMVTGYTRMWEKPMSAYTVLVNSFVFFLAPVVMIMLGNGSEPVDAVADFILFALVTPVFSQSIMKIMYLDQAVGQAGEAVRRLDSLAEYPQIMEPATPSSPEHFNVRFEHVTFSYPGSSSNAVDDVSFEIPEGKTVALVGPSGGGKTTIARLIPRFWDVSGGSVSIGGVDVRNIRRDELMKDVSFVFQNAHLFKTTLLENIRCGNMSADDESVDRAIDAARCREIIDRLPDGLMTKIGTDGTYLSGGEQQRIALARAILKDAPVVVLDEATAFADPENEHLIRKALGSLMKGKTVLMIAHRLSTIVDADMIMVIDGGRIREQGTHEELLATEGIYSCMWNEYMKSTDWKLQAIRKSSACK